MTDREINLLADAIAKMLERQEREAQRREQLRYARKIRRAKVRA